MEQQKILRVLGYPLNQFGSLERYVMRQAIVLNEHGEHMDIVFDGVRSQNAVEDLHKFAPSVNVCYFLPNLFASPSIWMRVKYLIKSYNLFKEGKYNIVHVYFCPPARLINYLAPLFPHIRFIRTIGSIPDIKSNNLVVVWLKKMHWRLKLRNLDHIICVSESIKKHLVECGINHSRMSVVYDGVDISVFKKTTVVKKSNNVFRLTFAGRLEPVKQINILLDGIDMLVHKMAIRNVHLKIVGDGSLSKELKSIVERKRISKYVTFEGQSRNVSRIFVEQTDVYVQASRLEGLSASVLEAMACELPVVVTNIGGHKEAVVDKETGFLFSVGNVSEFVDYIYRLLCDNNLCTSMGKLGRQRIIEKFSLDSRIEQEYHVYKKLLS